MRKTKRFKVTVRLKQVTSCDLLVNIVVEGGYIWQAWKRAEDDLVDHVTRNWGHYNSEWIKRITVTEIR